MTVQGIAAILPDFLALGQLSIRFTALMVKGFGLVQQARISAYKNEISPLKTPVSDAIALFRVLENSYNYAVIKLLDTEATLQELNRLLDDLKQETPLPNILVIGGIIFRVATLNL